MRPGVDATRVGEVIGGKYRVIRLLAKGGMAVVYEAQHAVVRRRFAVKFLRRDLAERRDILTRFQREAEAAGALENENVAASVDFGITDDGTPYIVMEYLAGESLAALLERAGRLPVARAADLIVQASRGIAAAHAAEIVHRDLKPQNLFVSRRDDGTDLLKVLDFGVAKLQALDEASAATRTGTMLGTAAYMSPEQARGEKTVDARADVYALGAILYELVSLKRPHPGESQNAILHHIATHPAVPLESVQPDLPSDLVALVGRTVATDPTARPASADALACELAPFARREVWPAPPDSSAPTRIELTSTVLAQGDAEKGIETADREPSSNRPASDGPASAPPRGRRRAGPLVAGALLIAAVAIVVARMHPTATRAPGALPPRAPDPASRAEAPPPPRPPADPVVPEPVAPAPPMVPALPTVAGRPAGHKPPRGRPAGHIAAAPSAPAPAGDQAAPAPPAPPARADDRPTPARPVFDPHNPYR